MAPPLQRRHRSHSASAPMSTTPSQRRHGWRQGLARAAKWSAGALAALALLALAQRQLMRRPADDSAPAAAGSTAPYDAARWGRKWTPDSGRIYCWVPFVCGDAAKRPLRHAIMATWGRRCGRLFFMCATGVADENIGALVGNKTITYREERVSASVTDVYLPMVDSYEANWLKTRLVLKYFYQRFGTGASAPYDWLLRGNDDAYVIMENLMQLLSHFRPEDDYHIGHKMKGVGDMRPFVHGAVYVFSRPVLAKFIGAMNSGECERAGRFRNEDNNLAPCFATVGVRQYHATGDKDELRFSFTNPLATLNWPPPAGSSKLAVKPHLLGLSVSKVHAHLECCAADMISFHHLKAEDFWVIEYFVYKFHRHTVPQ